MGLFFPTSAPSTRRRSMLRVGTWVLRCRGFAYESQDCLFNDLILGVRQLVPAQEKYSGSTKLCTYEEIQNQSWGREIDILVKHDQGSSNFIELSSLDVKPASAGAAVVKGQQN